MTAKEWKKLKKRMVSSALSNANLGTPSAPSDKSREVLRAPWREILAISESVSPSTLVSLSIPESERLPSSVFVGEGGERGSKEDEEEEEAPMEEEEELRESM